MKKYLSLLCCIFFIAIILNSCERPKILNTVESNHFKVESRKLNDFLDIYANDKIKNDEHRIIGIERDPKVFVHILDDSILLVTNIKGSGYSLIANLNNNVASYDFRVGDAPLQNDAKQLKEINNEGWSINLDQLNTRSDMFILNVLTPGDSASCNIPNRIIILGAQGIELQSIIDGKIDFTIKWSNNQANESQKLFRLDCPENAAITADRFSLVQK